MEPRGGLREEKWLVSNVLSNSQRRVLYTLESVLTPVTGSGSIVEGELLRSGAHH